MKTGNKLFWMLAASVLSFAGCEIVEVKDAFIPETVGSTFELVADIAQTRTTVDPEDGYKVSWEEGDVIYMVTDDETWGKPYESSSVTNIETIAEFVYGDGKFTTEATIDDGEYTFNAMYCAADNKSWHRGAGSTHKLSAVQNQDCTNPTAHIKNYDALVGTFTTTLPVENPQSVAMHHIYTLMQVNVVNNTGAAIEVAKFEMTVGGADLVGIFNVDDFATSATSVKTGYGETITVNVSNGTVSADESLPIYFVVSPFTSDAEKGITFKVTDASGNTYTKTVNKAITFSAGTYNTTPYTITKADEVEEIDYSGKFAAVVCKSNEYVYLTTNASGKRLATDASGVSNITDYSTTLTDFKRVSPEYIWSINKIEGSSYYTMCANSLYIKKVTTSSNYAYTDESEENAEPVKITYNAEKKCYMIESTTSGYAGRKLAVNTTEAYYAFYGSTTTMLTDIILIPYEEDTTPILSVPSNIQSVVDQQTKTITITWDAVPNASKYVVLCDDLKSEVNESQCVINVAEYGMYTVTIEAFAEGYYSSKSDPINVEVVDPSVSTTTVTFNCNDSDFVADTDCIKATNGVIIVTQEKAKGSSFDTKYLNPLRFYAANTLTISGAVITKIEIGFNGTYKGDNLISDVGSFNGTIWVPTENNESETVVLTNNGNSQTRIDSITITYKNK